MGTQCLGRANWALWSEALPGAEGPPFGKFCGQVLRRQSRKMLVLYYDAKLPAGTD